MTSQPGPVRSSSWRGSQNACLVSGRTSAWCARPWKRPKTHLVFIRAFLRRLGAVQKSSEDFPSVGVASDGDENNFLTLVGVNRWAIIAFLRASMARLRIHSQRLVAGCAISQRAVRL